MELGNIHNEEEKCHGLAQSNALDGFLYRTLRRNWLFDTSRDIVITIRWYLKSAGFGTNERKHSTHAGFSI